MSDSLNLEPADTSHSPACANCGRPPLQGDYPTALCQECRDHFVKFPIPVWIWAFAAGILVLMLFGFYKMPADLSAGIGLEKAKNAFSERRYMTAERELKLLAAKMPQDPEANGRLMIAAFYNNHYELFVNQIRKGDQIKYEDGPLLTEMNNVATEGEILLTTDSFKVFSAAHPDQASIPDVVWLDYFSRNNGDNNARMLYSYTLFDRKEYQRCDSLSVIILATYPGDTRTLMLEASCKREEAQYDSALYFTRQILTINKESVDGLASEARTLLRMKQDRKGLEEARKAYELDANEAYAQASLILAYHFNGRTGDRDALIGKAVQSAKDSTAKTTLQYALDVIAKKEKFRD